MGADEQILTYENVIDEFLRSLPEFKGKAEEERKWWDGEPGEEPLRYIFFGNVLHGFLVQALRTMDNPDLLKRLFAFFERMALSPDEKVPELLTTGTLEYLGDDKVILQRARKLMGWVTLKLSHDIEKGLGRE